MVSFATVVSGRDPADELLHPSHADPVSYLRQLVHTGATDRPRLLGGAGQFLFKFEFRFRFRRCCHAGSTTPGGTWIITRQPSPLGSGHLHWLLQKQALLSREFRVEQSTNSDDGCRRVLLDWTDTPRLMCAPSEYAVQQLLAGAGGTVIGSSTHAANN